MPSKPNILLVISDQLSQQAIGAVGHSTARTPTIDRLIREGTRFANAYTPCPICMPARAAFWTGRYPHDTGVPGNDRDLRIPDDMPTLGTCLGQAGYFTAHFGKRHDMGGLRGFDVLDGGAAPVSDPSPWPWQYETEEDRYTTQRTTEFLNSYRGEAPYLAVADLNNPHEICLWIGDNALTHTDAVCPDPLPALPHNFRDADRSRRPLPVQLNCCANFRVAQTQGWTETNFQTYLAAYDNYVQQADAEIGTILNALAQRPDADNTIVILMADHGEGMAAHGMVTKAGHFYEEITHVPFVVSGAGIPAGVVHEQPLVSLLDLVPTICELSGATAPADASGRSLVPWLQESPPSDPGPDYVISTWLGGGDLQSPARMVRTARYKYMHFREDDGEELYDLESDPGETRTLIDDPEHAEALRTHRRLLREHCEQTGDPFFDLPVVVLNGRHAHAPGACPFHGIRG